MEDRLLKIVEDIKNNVFSELVAETPELMCEEFDKDVSALFACLDRKSTRLNSSHMSESRMPSSA